MQFLSVTGLVCHFFRHLVIVHQQKFLLPDNIQLVKFLLRIVDCSRAHLISSSYTSANQRSAAATGKRLPKYSSLWEVQTVAFTMLGESFERVGSSFPADVWQSTIEVRVLLWVVDCLYSNGLLSYVNCKLGA